MKEERESIINLLNSEKVNSKTDDDKTILVCLFEKLPISNSSVRDRDTSKVENVSNVSDEDTSVEETEDTSLESETQVATDEVKPLKPDARLNTFLILFSQSVVFGFLTGIFLHYNYHISKIPNILSKLYHSLLLVIIIGFISLFEIVTFLELKKQIKKANASEIKTYFLAFILLCFGIGLGWLVYYLIYLLNN